jgi:DNA-binding NarL/FixJ family response regulator
MQCAVLIVEDEGLIAFHLQSIVEEAGHRVIGMATEPAVAIKLAQLERPDFALMDIRLARRTSGVDAARLLYEQLGVRSIFLSANIDAELRAKTAAFSPLGYLGKPFMVRDVLTAIQRAVNDLQG